MTTDKLTITLTNAAPVSIIKADWPVIASAKESPGSFVNGTPRPDHECDTHRITVRQHEDGRAIVYGVLSASTAWTGTEGSRGGVLVAAGGDLVAAIQATCRDCNLLDSVERECIADLPAVEIQ